MHAADAAAPGPTHRPRAEAAAAAPALCLSLSSIAAFRTLLKGSGAAAAAAPAHLPPHDLHQASANSSPAPFPALAALHSLLGDAARELQARSARLCRPLPPTREQAVEALTGDLAQRLLTVAAPTATTAITAEPSPLSALLGHFLGEGLQESLSSGSNGGRLPAAQTLPHMPSPFTALSDGQPYDVTLGSPLTRVSAPPYLLECRRGSRPWQDLLDKDFAGNGHCFGGCPPAGSEDAFGNTTMSALLYEDVGNQDGGLPHFDSHPAIDTSNLLSDIIGSAVKAAELTTTDSRPASTALWPPLGDAANILLGDESAKGQGATTAATTPPLPSPAARGDIGSLPALPSSHPQLWVSDARAGIQHSTGSPASQTTLYDRLACKWEEGGSMARRGVQGALDEEQDNEDEEGDFASSAKVVVAQHDGGSYGNRGSGGCSGARRRKEVGGPTSLPGAAMEPPAKRRAIASMAAAAGSMQGDALAVKVSSDHSKQAPITTVESPEAEEWHANSPGCLKAASTGRQKRGTATDPQSVAARKRRDRIRERIQTLQQLVPSGSKMDTVSMLDELIEYVKFLQVEAAAKAARCHRCAQGVARTFSKRRSVVGSGAGDASGAEERLAQERGADSQSAVDEDAEAAEYEGWQDGGIEEDDEPAAERDPLQAFKYRREVGTQEEGCILEATKVAHVEQSAEKRESPCGA